jgi:PTH2 family peptidyl-tRNA hydrolase
MKQVILVRADLKMSGGKLAAQVAHGSVEAVLKSDKKKVREWRDEGMKKVVLKVADKRELMKYKRWVEQSRMVNALITDAAKTFFTRPTTTVLAIGPAADERIDKVTGDLKML